MLRNVEVRSNPCRIMSGRRPSGPSAGKVKIQFNIRVDADILEGFRAYCARNGLDPHGQIVLFMKRVLDTEFDFQDRLWTALREEPSA